MYNAMCAVNHTVYMCGLNASGQCGQGPPTNTTSGSADNHKIVVRPTLINMPVFDFYADADLMKFRSNNNNNTSSSSNRLFPLSMKFNNNSSSSKSKLGDRPGFCDSIKLVLGKYMCVLV